MNDTIPVEDTKPVEILLVEDNPDDAELTLRTLRRVANNIVWVKDGVEALEFLFARGKYAARQGAGSPRLVLLDLKLPKLDGFEVLRQVRANPATRRVPIVALTSSAEERDLIETYANEINSYITKPAAFAEFQKVVESLGMYWVLMNRTPDHRMGVSVQVRHEREGGVV